MSCQTMAETVTKYIKRAISFDMALFICGFGSRLGICYPLKQNFAVRRRESSLLVGNRYCVDIDTSGVRIEVECSLFALVIESILFCAVGSFDCYTANV